MTTAKASGKKFGIKEKKSYLCRQKHKKIGLCLKSVNFSESLSTSIGATTIRLTSISPGEYECCISVIDRVVDGKAPTKVIAKVNEWMDLHEAEILTLWEKVQKGEKLGRIEPLK